MAALGKPRQSLPSYLEYPNTAQLSVVCSTLHYTSRERKFLEFWWESIKMRADNLGVNWSSPLGTNKQTNACYSLPRSQTSLFYFKSAESGKYEAFVASFNQLYVVNKLRNKTAGHNNKNTTGNVLLGMKQIKCVVLFSEPLIWQTCHRHWYFCFKGWKAFFLLLLLKS